MTFDLNDPREYLQALDQISKAEEENRPITFSINLTRNYEAVRKILNSINKRIGDVEITRKQKPKTESQNNYLHFLCQYYASEYGCSTVEAKEIYLKRYACPDIFESKKLNKFGKTITTYRSTADLSVTETSSAIRNFIEWAALGDIILPLPEDKPLIRHAKREIEKTRGMI